MEEEKAKFVKKQPYHPEQHSEFIDAPENLTGGKTPKNTKLAEGKSIKERERNLINNKKEEDNIAKERINNKKPKTYETENTKQPNFDEFVKSINGGFPSEEMANKAYELFKNKNWNELEKLFNKNNINEGWPPNRGFISTKTITLKKGFFLTGSVEE